MELRAACAYTAPNGPYHTEGNLIFDRQNRPYLIRGTKLSPLVLDESAKKGSLVEFRPLSATTLITIRQRLNMNAVRIPVSVAQYEAGSAYKLRLEEFVRLANRLELLVIIEASEPFYETQPGDSNLFWADLAARFRDNPDVFFAPLSARRVRSIRQTGALQLLIIDGPETALLGERNIIYEVTPHYAALKTDAGRRKQFDDARGAPLLVNGLDPEFDQRSEGCAAFPSDPADATVLVLTNLAYFDSKQISWTLSSFTPGKLITDYRYYNGTKLDDGWACGEPATVAAGLGMVVLSHLWGATPLGLFAVSESRGGLVIARGGISAAYGPILADREMNGHGPRLPTRLANISIRITDSHGVARLAPILHTGAGWAFVSFVVPDECATGPAEVAVVRMDGSTARSRVLIGNLAPGLFTAPPDGRSIAVGQVTQHAAGKPEKSFATWKCGIGGCQAVPISLSPKVSTTLRLVGTGFRHAGDHPDFRVTVGGLTAPVVSFGQNTDPGTDQLTIRLPSALTGAGETDLYFTLNGDLSNVVRLDFGVPQ